MPAEIYDQFSQQISNLQEVADNNAQANLGEEQRDWRVPFDWEGDPFDIEGLGDPFDRTDMNEDYPEFFTDNSSVGDCMAAKIQADHLGSQERAFRLRHATSVRCCMHAASRRNGQGDQAAGSFARIVNHIQDLISAGSDSGSS